MEEKKFIWGKFTFTMKKMQISFPKTYTVLIYLHWKSSTSISFGNLRDFIEIINIV
jgi:hypothetical protein